MVKNVRCIDGYKHNIDVCAPRYPENNNGSTYDNEPSRYVTLQNCFTSGSGDDNITTHFSSDILIKGCRSIHPSGIRTEQNCNCFEIDDGSRNVTMINCTAIGGHKGLQIKGHSYAPAPYNVVVDDFKTYNNTTGIDIKHMDFDTGNSPTARNVNLTNISVVAPRDFTSEGGVLEQAQRGIRVSSYEDVKLVNVYISDDTVDMADDFLASSTTRSRGIVRVMEGASNVMFKNLNIVDEDILLVNPIDAKERELNNGDIARLYSGRGEVSLKVEVTDKVKEGIVFTTFHFPEHMVNMVTGDGKDEETKCAEYKVSAVQVQKIIRAFKQSGSVQKSISDFFLAAPNTFRLEFFKGPTTHTFLPQIKECALLSSTVNYMPENSYMTYEDSSMVSYSLSLAFQEIEPIFNSDYEKLDNNADQNIGF